MVDGAQPLAEKKDAVPQGYQNYMLAGTTQLFRALSFWPHLFPFTNSVSLFYSPDLSVRTIKPTQEAQWEGNELRIQAFPGPPKSLLKHAKYPNPKHNIQG